MLPAGSRHPGPDRTNAVGGSRGRLRHGDGAHRGGQGPNSWQTFFSGRFQSYCLGVRFSEVIHSRDSSMPPVILRTLCFIGCHEFISETALMKAHSHCSPNLQATIVRLLKHLTSVEDPPHVIQSLYNIMLRCATSSAVLE